MHLPKFPALLSALVLAGLVTATVVADVASAQTAPSKPGQGYEDPTGIPLRPRAADVEPVWARPAIETLATIRKRGVLRVGITLINWRDGAALAAAGVIVAGLSQGPVRAQSWNDSRAAVDACEQELEFRMAREAGARLPPASTSEAWTCSKAAGTPSWNPGPGGGGWGGSGSSAYPPTGRVFFSGGIINRATGKGLDVEAESRNDGANVQQWDFGAKANQSWDIIDLGRGEFSIVNRNSGKALDVARQDASDGANVQQFRWHNGDNQRWRLERTGGGFYQIVSVSSGRCLDVHSARLNENGANIQQWSCSGQPNQQWRLRR